MDMLSSHIGDSLDRAVVVTSKAEDTLSPGKDPAVLFMKVAHRAESQTSTAVGTPLLIDGDVIPEPGEEVPVGAPLEVADRREGEGALSHRVGFQQS